MSWTIPYRVLLLFLLFAVLLSLACQAPRMRFQGRQFREAVQDLYEDQILDNLIRAYERRPFVQLSYSDLFVQEIDKVSLNGSIGDTVTEMRDLTLGAMANASSSRMVAADWGFGGEASRAGTLSFKAKPVTDQNQIYQAYIDFANNTDLFKVVSRRRDLPNHKLIHVWDTRHSNYYYIPKSAASDYLDLALLTTFQLGPAASSAIMEVKILRAIQVGGPTSKGSVIANLILDKTVPNSIGALEITRGSNVITIPVQLQEYYPVNAPLNVLRAEWNEETRGITVDGLEGIEARFFTTTPPTTAPDVGKRLIEQLEGVESAVDRLQTLEVMQD